MKTGKPIKLSERDTWKLMEGCIKHYVDKLTGETVCDDKEYDDAIDFIFGDSLVAFIKKYGLPFDIVELQKKIFEGIVDYNYKKKSRNTVQRDNIVDQISKF